MGILEIENLSKHFGAVRAINKLNISFNKSQLTAIIGPNGAGKSTLYNVITGKFLPTEGRILFNGMSIENLKPYEIVKKGLGRSFQVSNIFPDMTVLENVRVALIVHNKMAYNLFNITANNTLLYNQSVKLLKMVGLEEVQNIFCNELPHGDKKKVELAISLANKPEVILLDEPTAGMTKEESRQVVDLIKKLYLEEGVGFILTEHDIEMVFEIADRIIVLNKGELLADGKPEEISKNLKVKEVYLGKVIV
jgi:branched-chain amino acid transport system ATP-binding protein